MCWQVHACASDTRHVKVFVSAENTLLLFYLELDFANKFDLSSYLQNHPLIIKIILKFNLSALK